MSVEAIICVPLHYTSSILCMTSFYSVNSVSRYRFQNLEKWICHRNLPCDFFLNMKFMLCIFVL